MITVYTIPNCPFCEKAKELLTEKGLDYTVVDLSKDAYAKEMVIASTGQRKAPVIRIDNEFIVGFDGLTEHFT